MAGGEEIHAYIPFELVLQILVRLQVKSLLRFKCVSKPWHSLISSDYFVKTHLNNNTIGSSLSSSSNQKDNWMIITCHDDTNTLMKLQFSLHSSCRALGFFGVVDIQVLEDPVLDIWLRASDISFGSTPIIFVGCCNGLICVAIGQKDVYLWNPSTRKSQKLPPHFGGRQELFSYTIYGFAYDEKNDDYIVVAVHCNLRFLKTEVNIYSLKTGLWVKNIDGIIPGGGYPFSDSGKFACGKLHWVCFSGKSDRFIVSFDVGKRRFDDKIIELLPECSFVYPVLKVLGDNLCIISCCNNDMDDINHHCLELWRMKDYGVKDSWVMIKLTPSPCHLGRLMPRVWISKEGEFLFLCDDDAIMYPRLDMSPVGVILMLSSPLGPVAVLADLDGLS